MPRGKKCLKSIKESELFEEYDDDTASKRKKEFSKPKRIYQTRKFCEEHNIDVGGTEKPISNRQDTLSSKSKSKSRKGKSKTPDQQEKEVSVDGAQKDNGDCVADKNDALKENNDDSSNINTVKDGFTVSNPNKNKKVVKLRRRRRNNGRVVYTKKITRQQRQEMKQREYIMKDDCVCQKMVLLTLLNQFCSFKIRRQHKKCSNTMTNIEVVKIGFPDFCIDVQKFANIQATKFLEKENENASNLVKVRRIKKSEQIFIDNYIIDVLREYGFFFNSEIGKVFKKSFQVERIKDIFFCGVYLMSKEDILFIGSQIYDYFQEKISGLVSELTVECGDKDFNTFLQEELGDYVSFSYIEFHE